ncbi:hypothetical protein Tco_1249334, partial [Tanacetum coccineum]
IVSSENTSSTNETVNTAHDVSTASSQGQIDIDDLQEMDLKWGHAYHEGEKILKEDRKESEFQCFRAEEGITNFAFATYTSQSSSSSSSSDSEVHTCSKDCLKSYETLQKQYDQHRVTLNKSNLEILCYQMGLESLEARIVVHEKNEAVYEKNITFLKYDVQVKDISIKDLKNQLEEALKEKDDLKFKLEKFEESSKNLTKLINKSDVDDSPINDRFKTGEGFHVVPPPYTGNYMFLRLNLSFAGLDDYVNKTKVSETETTISKTSKDIVEKPKTIRPSALVCA